jgi:hypothetical protein
MMSWLSLVVLAAPFVLLGATVAVVILTVGRGR